MKRFPHTLAAVILLLGLNYPNSVDAAGSGLEMMDDEPDESVVLYNQGVELMLSKRFTAAESKFRAAIKSNGEFAKAHNNLAYTLRKQGQQHFGEALLHYSRAIQLEPELPEPYMYRGVLFVQMGSQERALRDHAVLTEMDERLADELAYVVEHRKEKEPEQFFGVSGEIR